MPELPAIQFRPQSLEELRGRVVVDKFIRKDRQVRAVQLGRDYDLLYARNGVGFGDYIARERLAIVAKKQATTRALALAMARSKAAAVKSQINDRLAQIFREDRFDNNMRESLELGQSIGSTLGTLTNSLGPEAAIATTVVGYVVGAIAGFWPHEKEKLLADFRRLFSALTKYERWLVMPGFRSLIDAANTRIKQPITPPWRIGNDGGLLGHNLAEGLDVTVLLLLEVANEFDWAPMDSDPRVLAYSLALLGSYHEDGKRFDGMRDVWDKAKAGKPNRWIADAIVRSAAVTAGDARRIAVGLGLQDYSTEIITEDFLRSLVTIGGPNG